MDRGQSGLAECRHRGEEVRPGHYRCHTTHLVFFGENVVSEELCGRCPYADKPNADGRVHVSDHDLRCVHRGDILRTEKCKTCGDKESVAGVFQCSKHGECVSSVLYQHAGGHESNPYKNCKQCDDREKPAIVQLEIKPKKPKKKPAKIKHLTIKSPTTDITGLLVTRLGQPADFLQDAYAGAGVFLVCGGPSLKKMDLSLLKQRGIAVAAVNNVAATVVRPNIWISCDPQHSFHPVIWNDPAIMKFAKEKYLMQRLHVVEGGVKHDIDRMARNCPNVFGYHHCHGWNAETFLTQSRPTWGPSSKSEDPDGIDRHLSVMLIALRLLYWLGFRRVYLLGCDFKMKEGDEYAFDEKHTPAKVISNNKLYGWLNRRFVELQPHFVKARFQVYNCTIGGKLEGFPRMEFVDAIENESLTENVDTRGYY